MSRKSIPPRERRRRRRDLICFVDALGLFLSAGYDLTFGWPEALAVWRDTFEKETLRELEFSAENSFAGQLANLAENYSDERHRIWFGILGELYRQGAALSDAVAAISRTLKQEEQRDLEAMARALPLRTNLILIIFFFPPTVVLFFAPLLLALARDF